MTIHPQRHLLSAALTSLILAASGAGAFSSVASATRTPDDTAIVTIDGGDVLGVAVP
jgi:hypothetical protein